MTPLLLLLCFWAAAAAPRAAVGAQLPLQLRCALESALPPAVAAAPLAAFFEALPAHLCSLGADGIASLPSTTADELCPLVAAYKSALPPRLPAAAALDRAARAPRSLGGALALIAARGDAAAAAGFQRAACAALLNPHLACNASTRAEALATLTYSRPGGAPRTVAAALAGGAARAALVPLGAALARLPDALCLAPRARIAAMPQQMKWQLVRPPPRARARTPPPPALHPTPVPGSVAAAPVLLRRRPHAPPPGLLTTMQAATRTPNTNIKAAAACNMLYTHRRPQCPYDVGLVPIAMLLIMGRAGSGALHAKLCDALRREAACAGGRYRMDPITAERISSLRASAAADAAPRLLQVPRLPRALWAAAVASARQQAGGGGGRWWGVVSNATDW
ncbi:MAG: hypothetical protein J3K34DRAFT_244178 [Monoraphidium minutum]|nr:MAG: hypothetical protein J3K34DRAFT_244178 [Monoraphidium minutum]